MIEALIDGERRGAVLGGPGHRQDAVKRSRTCRWRWRAGSGPPRHAVPPAPRHLDHLDGMLAKLDAQIEGDDAAVSRRPRPADHHPGIGPLSAAAVISRSHGRPRVLPDAAHLASWTGLCPGNHESAGKHRRGKRRKGNQHLQPVPGSSAPGPRSATTATSRPSTTGTS